MDKTPLLKVNNLRKTFVTKGAAGRSSVLHAVDGVSFDIARGETLGLVGESGCGKTTLGRTILRLTEPTDGQIVFDGEDITNASMRPYRRRMQIIFQNPAGCLDPRTRINDTIEEGLIANKIGGSKAERRVMVAELLDKVGLDRSAANRYPHEFSGGMQQRVGIARALAVNPEFIVCDEPISALDVSYQSQIINLLKDMQASFGLTYLFISHDLSVVRHISNRIGVMYYGKLVELGGSGEIISNAAHPYTRSLISAIPVPDPKRRSERQPDTDTAASEVELPETGCKYRNLCGKATGLCETEIPKLREISPGHFCACFACGE